MGIKTKDDSQIDKLIKVVNELKHTEVQIGIFAEDDSFVAMIAAVHEFGTTIRPKNGKYLKIPMKEGGLIQLEAVTIPERSYIRAGFDANKADIQDFVETEIEKVLLLKQEPNVFFEKVGKFCVNKIREYLTDLSSPPNAPFTIEQKGSSNPLVDTGRLRRAIDYKVEKI